MTLLSRDAILKAQDVSTVEVSIPEWGGSIRVRSMTVSERNEFGRRVSSAEEKTSIGAWLVTLLSVDDKGGRLFKPEDVEALEQRNAKAVDAVVNAILEVNKVGEKEVEAAEKKS
jgi:hypothetical protein